MPQRRWRQFSVTDFSRIPSTDRIRTTGTNYEWKLGSFNSRNITDRDYFWTNLRRGVADEMHRIAERRPVVYLLACCKPADNAMNVWAVPEPFMYDGLANLPFEEDGQKYTVQVLNDEQRIHGYDASPDLTPYFQRFQLAPKELLVLNESRDVDDLVKRERAISRAEEDGDDGDEDVVWKAETNRLLAAAMQQLVEAGAFDPNGISDARERVLSAIVRRRGQPTFRLHLLAAYNSRCAITGCEVEAVLDAAHIVPYMGPETNHPGNGLLLRTDLHTLFDLKLVAVDVATMSLLVSPILANTCYEEYRGWILRVPDDLESQPSQKALEQHRLESGL